MTDRDNPGGGGLTGATGDLTPVSPDQAFEPGERGEVAGPDRAKVSLSPDDPAYAMQIHPPAGSDESTEGDARIGGDDRSDSEERF